MIPKAWIDAATESAKGFYDSCKRPDLDERQKMLGALVKYQMTLDALMMKDSLETSAVVAIRDYQGFEDMLVSEAVTAYHDAMHQNGRKPTRLGMTAVVRRIREKLWITALNQQEQGDGTSN